MPLLPAPLLRGAVDFNREVRPLLSDRCFACHGPDSATSARPACGWIRSEGATALLKSGNRAIVPGKPQESALFERIHATDPDDIMPPNKLNRPLTDAERSDAVPMDRVKVRAMSKHWAFIAPQNHPPPAVNERGMGEG